MTYTINELRAQRDILLKLYFVLDENQTSAIEASHFLFNELGRLVKEIDKAE